LLCEFMKYDKFAEWSGLVQQGGRVKQWTCASGFTRRGLFNVPYFPFWPARNKKNNLQA